MREPGNRWDRARRRLAAVALIVLVPAASPSDAQPSDTHSLIPAPVYLGVAGAPEWDGLTDLAPQGRALTLTFEANANAADWTLLIRQRDVKEAWTVALNGAPLGPLVRQELDLLHALPVPAGRVRTGRNTLHIASARADDVVLEAIVLRQAPMATVLDAAALRVTVTDPDGRRLPSRVTVAAPDGMLVPLQSRPGTRQAVRPGVVYTGGDDVYVGVMPGTYRVQATRGSEYGTDVASVTIGAGETSHAVLRIAREVPTDGWVAVDTHVHTVTLSGHGDASLEERALTLAGEGIDVAVATEHDRVADYGPALRAMAVEQIVTAVAGSEDTTARGHFNVFPAGPGAFTVLNHPHDRHGDFIAFEPSRVHPVTARGVETAVRPFDGMEVVNSGAMRSDWRQPLRSWFALLNRGLRVTPVGASDSHDVSRFIVGQGRTYVRAADTSGGLIDVDAALESLRAGRVVVSLGLWPMLRIGTAGPGEVTSAEAGVAEAHVWGPAWMRADTVSFYVNGEAAGQRAVTHEEHAVEKVRLQWQLPARAFDYYVVLVASGPGITAPAWAIPKPYQPTTSRWEPVVFGLTAPIYVDADGDGRFTSPRGYATTLVQAHGDDLSALVAALASHDEAVAVHVLELLHERDVDLDGPAMAAALAQGPPVARAARSRYRP